MILLDITSFLGRLHPLVVHLPIGFLLLGIIFHFLSYRKHYEVLKNAVPFTMLAGLVSTAIAGALGFLVASGGDYDFDILNRHRLAGIVLFFASGLLYVVSAGHIQALHAIREKLVNVLCSCVLLLLLYTGHQGGNLTHGADFLSMEVLMETVREKPATAEEALIFEDVVLPVLKNKCESCHRKGKQKGQLVLSTLSDILKGGKSGPAIVYGKPEESELLKRVTLDPDHEDFMPQDGKPPLSKTEIRIIRWWVERGEESMSKRLADVNGSDSIMRVVTSWLESSEESDDNIEVTFTQDINPLIPATTDMAAVDTLRKKGFMVRLMLHQPVMLDVTLPRQSGVKMSDVEPFLRRIAANVIWLNLSDNNLHTDDLDIISSLTNLEKLRLERNPIDDQVGDKLSSLKHIQAVNLNDTEVTNRVSEQLRTHPSLKRIYKGREMIKLN